MKVAIGACLGTSAVMVWALVWGPGGSQNATISMSLSETARPIASTEPESIQKPHALSENAAVSAAPGLPSDSVVYYEQTGRAFRVDLRTSKNEVLSETALPGFIETVWSPSSHEVVSSFDISGSRVMRYFDYTSKKSAPVGTAATAVAFSPNGERLAFVDTIDGASAIYIGGADGSDPRRILALRATDPVLSWPQNDLLFFASHRPDGNSSDLAALTPNGKLSVLISNKENLEYAWSRDGKKLLFSYFAGQGIELWYMDMSTGVIVPLSVSTGAGKCAWTPDSTTVVCGVPPEGSLARDVSSERTATRDDIVTINISSGAQQTIYTGQKGTFFGVTRPLVSSSGAFFVFINSFDRRLYRFTLP